MWKEHRLCLDSNGSLTTSHLHGLRGDSGETLTSLSPTTSSVLWGCYYHIYLVGVVLEKMLHPWVLKLEGVLESPGGLLKTLTPHPRVYALVSLGRSLTN